MSALEKRNTLTGYLFLMPNLIGFLIFTLLPVGASLILSTFSWDLINPPEFVGLGNYFKMFSSDRMTGDPLFLQVLRQTAYYVLLTIPPGLCVSLLLATLVNQKIRGKNIYRFFYFLPVVTSAVAVSLVWNWMYNRDFGLINEVLGMIGLKNDINWLGDVNIAMPAVAIVSIWQNAGYNMVIFLAGLQGIPRVLYEAADIDGVTPWQRFTHITLPMLSPTMFFVVVTLLIGSFQVFDLIFMLTDGGPRNTTKTIVIYIYENGFQFFRMGYASAMAWVLFLVIFVITIIQFRLQRNWVEYSE